ncbi:AAA family ATPase [Minisyncoccus archaeophilus]|jgi:dephospho-CoA kinase|uniref:AAA family ATPase n=1 Tax=Minisyncoccus archaeiphilus TaxID=3238481 RepID=UPI0009C6C584|nr:MAG: hypothetical protein BWY21_00795 [Parcubacteria group bacterium ADurb.Bin216]
MSKIVIGIVGKNGSGKDSVADYLVEKYLARKLVFSDMLREALSIFIDNEKIGRMDMAWFATEMRERYGEGILASGMRKRVLLSQEDIVVLSGLRDSGELDMLRSFESNCLIAIDTSAEIRWKRLQGRNKKADDAGSFVDFMKREDLETEKGIGDLITKADYLIRNDGTQEELWSVLDKLILEKKKRL